MSFRAALAAAKGNKASTIRSFEVLHPRPPVRNRTQDPRHTIPADCILPTVSAVPIDPNTLTEHEFACAENSFPRSESLRSPYPQPDPPWSLRPSKRAFSSLPKVYSGPFATQATLSARAPASQRALFQNMLHFLQSTSSPPEVLRLIEYHSAQPARLRSAKSFNILVALALRNAAFGHVEPLLRQMHNDGVLGNEETKKLIIRYLVRSGRWEDAWHQVSTTMEEERRVLGHTTRRQVGIPLHIWLELFATAKRGAFCRLTSEPSYRQLDAPDRMPITKLSSDAPPEHPESGKHRLLMRHYPKSAPANVSRTAARVLSVIVDAMLRTGKDAAALELTQTYLKGLPHDLDSGWQRSCRQLIHLHAVSRGIRLRGVRTHFAKRRTVAALLALHPQLTPNSSTLFLLLSSLQRACNPGTLGRRLVEGYKKRWGAGVEDARVRRRLAAFALKEGHVPLASAVLAREHVARRRRASWALRGSVLGGIERPVVSRAGAVREGDHHKWLRWRGELVYGRRGCEEMKWRALATRYRTRLRALAVEKTI